MQLIVNGEKQQLERANLTVAELLQYFSLSNRPVVVECNAEIVLKSEYEEAVLSDGDVVEIVHFVGGG